MAGFLGLFTYRDNLGQDRSGNSNKQLVIILNYIERFAQGRECQSLLRGIQVILPDGLFNLGRRGQLFFSLSQFNTVDYRCNVSASQLASRNSLMNQLLCSYTIELHKLPDGIQGFNVLTDFCQLGQEIHWDRGNLHMLGNIGVWLSQHLGDFAGFLPILTHRGNTKRDFNGVQIFTLDVFD